MTRFLTAMVVAGATVISTSACSAGGPRAEGHSPAAPPVTVLVENSNWADMTVYVEHAGIRTRLGTVTTATRRLFQLPRTLASIAASFRLVADPVGSADVYTTPQVQVTPGQQVNFVIENQVGISTLWVSNR